MVEGFGFPELLAVEHAVDNAIINGMALSISLLMDPKGGAVSYERGTLVVSNLDPNSSPSSMPLIAP